MKQMKTKKTLQRPMRIRAVAASVVKDVDSSLTKMPPRPVWFRVSIARSWWIRLRSAGASGSCPGIFKTPESARLSVVDLEVVTRNGLGVVDEGRGRLLLSTGVVVAPLSKAGMSLVDCCVAPGGTLPGM